jgi:hypothetical protein
MVRFSQDSASLSGSEIGRRTFSLAGFFVSSGPATAEATQREQTDKNENKTTNQKQKETAAQNARFGCQKECAWGGRVIQVCRHGAIPYYALIRVYNSFRAAHVIRCSASRSRLRDLICHTTAGRTAAHRKSDQRRDGLGVGGLRKRAYHFLRSFLITHPTNTQISHNAIRNPTISSSNPMNFQTELGPPGMYDGASAIAESTS